MVLNHYGVLIVWNKVHAEQDVEKMLVKTDVMIYLTEIIY